jgi:hypothetical protein
MTFADIAGHRVHANSRSENRARKIPHQIAGCLLANKKVIREALASFSPHCTRL